MEADKSKNKFYYLNLNKVSCNVFTKVFNFILFEEKFHFENLLDNDDPKVVMETFY